MLWTVFERTTGTLSSSGYSAWSVSGLSWHRPPVHQVTSRRGRETVLLAKQVRVNIEFVATVSSQYPSAVCKELTLSALTNKYRYQWEAFYTTHTHTHSKGFIQRKQRALGHSWSATKRKRTPGWEGCTSVNSSVLIELSSHLVLWIILNRSAENLNSTSVKRSQGKVGRKRVFFFFFSSSSK